MFDRNKILNYHSWKNEADRSCRPLRRFDNLDSDQKIKKTVIKGLILLFSVYLIYLLFFSQYLAITKVNIETKSQNFNTEEFKNYITEALQKKYLFIFPRNNYFLFSRSYLKNEIKKKYLLEELVIQKKFPNTLNFSLKEKIANVLLQNSDKTYVVDLNGRVTSEIGQRIIINENKVPKVINETSSLITINEQILTGSMVTLIINLYEKFDDYITTLKISYFKIGDLNPSYIKLITTTGLEIYLNDRSEASEQLNKLKLSLENNMIDLTKIKYINLRVKDQVIYK